MIFFEKKRSSKMFSELGGVKQGGDERVSTKGSETSSSPSSSRRSYQLQHGTEREHTVNRVSVLPFGAHVLLYVPKERSSRGREEGRKGSVELPWAQELTPSPPFSGLLVSSSPDRPSVNDPHIRLSTNETAMMFGRKRKRRLKKSRAREVDLSLPTFVVQPMVPSPLLQTLDTVSGGMRRMNIVRE